MTSGNEQQRMRLCYQHWLGKQHNHKNIEQLTIITYAMFLQIIDHSKNEEPYTQSYIESARTLFNHGIQFGWINTH